MKIELNRVEKEKQFISNVRGYGLHLGFDLENEAAAHSVQRWLWRNGINVNKVGPRTLGLRPALTLSVKDGALLRNSLLEYHENFER